MNTDNKKHSWFILTLEILLFLFLNGAGELFAYSLKINELSKISTTYYSDVFINGNYAYCTDGNGLDILNIKDPDKPTKIGHYESPGNASAVEVRHNYAFIADGLQGLQVVNVANPANPVQVGNWNSIGTADDNITTVVVRGNYTYALSHRLLVFDTSIPTNPNLVGTFTYKNPYCEDDPDCNGIFPIDLFVNSQYAYLVDFNLGLWVVDLSNPSSPKQVAWLNIYANVYEVWVSDNFAYLAAGRNGMQVIDISDPSNPVSVANYYGPENHDTTGVFVSGTRAYVSYGDQLDIVDIFSPWEPVRTARYTGCTVEKVFVRGNYAYIANEYRTTFTILDVSNPYKPFEVGALVRPHEPRAIALKNNYAYIADRLSYLWVINVADATKPVIAGKYNAPENGYNVAVKGNYVYVTSLYTVNNSNNYGRLTILNISNPTTPVLVGQCTTPGIPTGIFISGNYAYLPNGEIDGLAIIDISIPATPVIVGRYAQTGTLEEARDVFVKGNYAYLAFEDNGLYILDISTPSNPKLIGKYRKEGDTVMAVTVRNNYAYLSIAYEGLVILDITNPTQPKPTSRFKTLSGSDIPVVLSGNIAYLLSNSSGIYAIDISNPSSPSLACKYGDYDVLGFGQDMRISGDKLYVVSYSGFYILQVQPVTSTAALTVQSIPDTGASISVAPPDVFQKGNGVTEFTRSYNTGTVVTLTAPTEYLGKNFSKWLVDGVESTVNRNLEVTMNANHTARACYETAAPPVINLNRDHFYFGVRLPAEQGVQTGAQTLVIANSGGGLLHWSAVPSQSWLHVEPGSGAGNTRAQVFVKAGGLPQGTYTGFITVSDPDAANSPQTVTVTLKVFQDTTPPFGSFDTPVDGSVVRSSIAVTGWALDDLGIGSVKIYRDGNGSLVYIGDALLVEGARPDVETAYPTYPNNYKAGWGYMLLTNCLPEGGNGTYILTAIATDMEGNKVTLGSKTITADNAHAVKPFGAIDTPTQGGTASGKNFVNYGWALTPQPNAIPFDGSTINVVIDGVLKGQPVYNIFRSDVAALFPGYANTDGAGGYYNIDTTKLKNGLHTITWLVTDNAGNSDGIGSRYFTVENLGNSGVRVQESGVREKRRGAPACAPFLGSCAPDFDSHSPSFAETTMVEIKELERIEINLSAEGLLEGYSVVGNQLRELPIGSTLDRERGIFYWQPGPGFLGEFHLVFINTDSHGNLVKKAIRITIIPGS